MLPAHRITTTFFAQLSCALCGRDWPGQDPPVPTVYTLASIEADDPPQPVCDLCVEREDPQVFTELLADRRRFYAS